MACAIVCPWAGPRINVRRISISSVPWRISPASGGLFGTTGGASTRMTMQKHLTPTRMPMGSALRVFSLWQFASEEASDEYLQATILSVDSGRVEGSMWLVPGVAVSSAVITGVDTNRDGTLSEAEQQAYAQRVLRDLLLKIDGQLLALHL